MPTIFPAYHRSTPGTGARVDVEAYKFPRKFLVLFLIVMLAFPFALFSSLSNHAGRATAANRVPAPVTAPPEPFLTHKPPAFTSLDLDMLASFSRAFIELTVPSKPEGLGAAHVPTISERVSSSIASVMAFAMPAKARTESAGVLPSPPQPSSVVDFDFDNDGKADIGRWHTANTEFKVRNSNGGSFSIFTVGSSSSIASPGDFNGDGKTDAAVFNAGTWKYKTSTAGSEQTISWGTTGDVPVAGDYDGDGITDAAIYRPSTNTWWVSKSTGGYTSTAHGSSGDITVPGDYDGDGKNDLAVYRPSDGYWYIVGSTAGSYALNWGIAIDIPVPADYDGDGETDVAVFRPSTGTWYARRSSDGSTLQQTWGNWADQPVPGDYDGDNEADFAIWRPTTALVHTQDVGLELRDPHSRSAGRYCRPIGVSQAGRRTGQR